VRSPRPTATDAFCALADEGPEARRVFVAVLERAFADDGVFEAAEEPATEVGELGDLAATVVGVAFACDEAELLHAREHATDGDAGNAEDVFEAGLWRVGSVVELSAEDRGHEVGACGGDEPSGVGLDELLDVAERSVEAAFELEREVVHASSGVGGVMAERVAERADESKAAW
jgi:hypothetical protein